MNRAFLFSSLFLPLSFFLLRILRPLSLLVSHPITLAWQPSIHHEARFTMWRIGQHYSIVRLWHRTWLSNCVCQGRAKQHWTLGFDIAGGSHDCSWSVWRRLQGIIYIQHGLSFLWGLRLCGRIYGVETNTICQWKVGSCSPLSSTGTALATAQIVQKNLEVPFETMDNLLMAVSPMFRERFQQALYDKLESVHRHQQQQQQTSTTVPITSATTAATSPSIPSLASGSSIQQHQTSHILLQQPSLLQNTHLQHQPQQQQPSLMTQQSMQDQSTLDITTQEVLDDLHNWIH